MNVPVPVPELVFVLNAIVGLILVFQTTPLEVMLLPPSELIVVVMDAVAALMLVLLILPKLILLVSPAAPVRSVHSYPL